MSLFNLFKKDIDQSNSKAKPDLDSTFFNMNVKQLPSNFAQTLMDLQMRLQFQETYELETVRELNDLYKLAVEYYVCYDPKKATHFQRKLTSLLSNPQTLSVMDNGGVEQPNAQIQHHYSKQLHSQLGCFNAQSTVVVQKMMEGSNNRILKSSRLVNQQITDQQSLLQSRLQKRSKSKSRKPNLPSPQR